MPCTSRRQFLTAVMAAALVEAGPWRLRAADPPVDSVYERLLAEYVRSREQFGRDLERLAGDADTAGLGEDAAAIRQLAQPADERSLAFDDLPDTMLPEIGRAFPPPEREIQVRLRAIRADYANQLFEQSLRARQKGQISLAWRLVRETAFHNSDHLKARKLLGFVQHEGQWTTPFRRQMIKAGKVWDPTYGWLPKDHVERYKNSERFYNGKWMSAQREEALRADFKNAWDVESDHFRVRTNHSLERAVEISVELERFHEFFTRSFAAVFMSPQQIQQLFEGTANGTVPASRRHIVHYYRDRAEFVKRLQARQREAPFINGVYLPDDRITHFFHKPDAPEEVEETLFHETTHQLLSESLKQAIQPGLDSDFWIIEGLACYLESFKPAPHGGSVGDADHVRIHWARTFLTESPSFYVPMQQFTAMPQRDFQCMNMVDGADRVDRLQRLYAQAAGLSHFFLHYRDGVYRDAFIEYLSKVYSPDKRIRERVPSLDELTGVSFAVLDQQYHEHIAGRR